MLEAIQNEFNSAQSVARVSLADLIVLAGNVGVEQAAKAAGHESTVPFAPGRTDASQEQTDVHAFAVMEPVADGFRNYKKAGLEAPAEALLIDKAQLLTLTAPEMTALIGGLRAININAGGAARRAHRPARRADERLLRQPAGHGHAVEGGLGRPSCSKAVTARPVRQVDRHPRRPCLRLELGTARLGRGLCQSDGKEKFVKDFVAAWTKVMNLDRFDLV